MPTNARLQSVGLRPTAAGRVAYAASPWLWKAANCQRLLIIACLVTGIGVGMSAASDESWLSPLFNLAVLSGFLVLPASRCLSRQRRLAALSPESPERVAIEPAGRTKNVS